MISLSSWDTNAYQCIHVPVCCNMVVVVSLNKKSINIAKHIVLPGQYGSTDTPEAFKMVWILSS